MITVKSCGANTEANRKNKKTYRPIVEGFKQVHCDNDQCDHGEACPCEVKSPCSNCGDEFPNLDTYNDHVNKCFSGTVRNKFNNFYFFYLEIES